MSLGAAIVGGVAAAFGGAGPDAPIIGWDILALVCGWVWATVWSLTPDATASQAKREDPRVDLADVVLLGAAIASLIAVGGCPGRSRAYQRIREVLAGRFRAGVLSPCAACEVAMRQPPPQWPSHATAQAANLPRISI